MASREKLPYEITLRVRDTCLCLHVQRAARAAARLYDEALRPAGLTSGQFSLLMSLNRPEPASIGEIAALLAMDRTTLTANVKPLRRRGLIAIVVDPRDRRSRRLVLTPSGHELLLGALNLWRRAQRSAERRLGTAGAENLRAGLSALA